MPHDEFAGRRQALKGLAALACGAALPSAGLAAPAAILERPVPATGEKLPAIGMGTWLTFDVSPGAERDARLPVLREFFAGGGTLLDSSPMYGYAEAALGDLVPRAKPARVFNATKVWTPTRFLGVKQMEQSFAHWGVRRFDLMQVHNMLDWETHLVTLKAWKAVGAHPLHRHHHLARAAARRPRGGDEARALRFRAVQLQLRRPECGAAPPAARGGPGRGGHREPPLRRRRPLRRREGQAPARLGAGDRLRQLGAGLPQVRGLAPRGHLRHPRDDESRRTCARTWARSPGTCPTRPCGGAWPPTSTGSRRCPRTKARRAGSRRPGPRPHGQ